MHKVNPKSETWPAMELDALRAEHLYRSLTTYPQTGGIIDEGKTRWLNFASNDYLDLAHHPRLIAAAAEALHKYGTGATASRLVTGTTPIHEALEQDLAAHKGYPSALVFGSGYLTNCGVLSALLGKSDHAFADCLIHASVIDAVRLSGARLHRFAHNDPAALEALLRKHTGGRRMVLTESVFSMDGDLAPLPELAAVARAHEAWFMVDEAHAGGVFGPNGAGRVRADHLVDQVTLSMGTFSKALGGYGGYVACLPLMREWLINRSRAFIYTTALPPAVMAAARAALMLLEEQPAMGPDLLKSARRFREQLQAFGLDTLQSESQIVPVLVGDNAQVMRLAERLQAQGLICGAMRPPTVPSGRARLRLSVTRAHTPADLDHAASLLRQAFHEEGLC